MPTKKSIKECIFDNYTRIEKMMINELNLATGHDVLTGNYREETWINLLRQLIPQKFVMEQGVLIIDSNENVSKEVDIAVIDNNYTPYIMQYGSLKLIPIEAVAIAIECKSTSYNLTDLEKWKNSIAQLMTNRSGIARMVNGLKTGYSNMTQISTRPIFIFCNLDNSLCSDKIKENFDITISAVKEIDNKSKTDYYSRLDVNIINQFKSLDWWSKELNGLEQSQESAIEVSYQKDKAFEQQLEFLKSMESEKELCAEKIPLAAFSVQKNNLLSLNFQLNQLLMLINNPMLFPHLAYATMFNKKDEEVLNDNQAPSKN